MNPSPLFSIWWKEFRAVLPIFGILVFVLLAPTFIGLKATEWDPMPWRLFSYPVGLIVLVSSVFCREFQDRTMMSQLLLPQSRFAPLARKIGTVIVLQLLLLIVYLTVGAGDWWMEEKLLWNYVLATNMVALSSACFWSLLLRQAIVATVVAVVSPLVIVFSLLGIIDRMRLIPYTLTLQEQNDAEMWWTMLGFSVYSAGCVVGALICWNRLQAKERMPASLGLEASIFKRLMLATGFTRRPAWVALVRKELGVQRFIFWLAALMLGSAILFTLGDLYLEHLIQSTSAAEGHLRWQRTIRGVASGLFVIFTTLIPILAGSQAFGEESHIGNRAWQLTLPMSPTKQWAIKLGTAVSLSLILGVLLPLMIVLTYASLRVGDPLLPEFEAGALSALFLGHLLLLSMTAWQSSWSTNTMAGIMKAIVGVILSIIVLNWLMDLFMTESSARGVYYRTGADWSWGAAALVVGALFFTLSNHQRFVVGKKLALFQATVVFGLVTFAMFLGSKIG